MTFTPYPFRHKNFNLILIIPGKERDFEFATNVTTNDKNHTKQRCEDKYRL